MKKIVFVLPNLNAGGAERVIATYLRQLADKNYDNVLVVFDLTEDLKPLIPENVKIENLATKSTKKSIVALWRALKELKPSYVITTHSRVAALLMILKPLLPVFIHFARMQSMPSLEIKFRQYGLLHKLIFSLAFRSADKVIAQTNEMAVDAVELFGVPSGKVITMPNPIDHALILTKSVEPCSEDLPLNAFNVVASGRLRTERGFDILLRAFAGFLKSRPNARLTILGEDRGALAELLHLRDELGLNEVVSFKGFNENPYAYYSRADLFVLSSRWEGFPNALIENYVLNSPIVATRCIPIIERFIVDGVNGYTCEAESIDSLLSALVKAQSLSRSLIDNPFYAGSNIEVYFE